ncbi:MAG: hypothetical protein V1784_04910 [bacterium]
MNIVCPVIAELRRQMIERTRLAWASYEVMKSDWLSAHPQATPDEVAAACREISDQLGL